MPGSRMPRIGLVEEFGMRRGPRQENRASFRSQITSAGALPDNPSKPHAAGRPRLIKRGSILDGLSDAGPDVRDCAPCTTCQLCRNPVSTATIRKMPSAAR
jgi:hypothetical protein